MMNKLNKIFYGPAGTGKTRRAIEEAVKIVQKSDDKHKLNFLEFNTSTYKGITECFRAVSNLPELDITHKKLLDDIHDLKKDVDFITKHKGYKGYLEDFENPKNHILKYRLYPLIETVTFHPSYSYQDFVEGITVETNKDDNSIEYKVKDGIFKKICDRARKNKSYNYVLIIDEINRGDISSIFGELFTLLEDSKRLGEDEELSINLPYSKDDEKGNPRKLVVPKNLYIIATMNTVDKSIALIDVALRRRFDFEKCMPESGLVGLRNYKGVDLPKLLDTMNERITILKNENYQIGHSYFLNIENFNELKNIMIKSILPLLQEYFYDDWKSICAVLNQNYNKPTIGLLKVKQNNKNLFKDDFKDLIEYTNQNIFIINEDFKEQYIKDIYSNN